MARLFVFPPARSREGSSLGLLIDAFGNDLFLELYRVVSSFGAGWLFDGKQLRRRLALLLLHQSSDRQG